MQRSFFTLLVATCSSFTFAQNTPLPSKDKKNFWDRVYTGGGLGLNFGAVTFVNVSPIIGYRVTEKYSAGIGLTYIYYNDKRYVPALTDNIYGGSIFNRLLLFDFLIAHAELEIINGHFDYPFDDRITFYNVWAGGGIRQSLGGRSYFYLLALWNLNPEGLADYYFPSPQIRGGVAVGL